MKDFLKIPQKFFYTYKNFLNKQYEFYKNNSSQYYLECTLERYNKTLYKAQVKSFSKENKFFFNFLQSLKIDEILICKSDTTSFEWVEVVLKNIDFKFREGKYTYTLYLQFPKDFQYREGVIHWHLLKPDYKLISYDLQKKVLENSFSKSLVSDSTEASEFLEQKYFKVFGNFYFDPFHDSDNEEDEQTPKDSKKDQTKDMKLIFENLQKELEIPIQTLKTKIKETFPNSSNSKLNDPYQEYCISSIQKAISFDGKQGLGNVFCIWGPPGTGKTTVIVELCKRLIKNKPDILIAITSFTNVAVDNVLEKLLNHNKEIKMKRNGLEARVRPSIQPITKMISKEDLVDLNILGVTLDSLLFPKWELNQEGDERIFDLTIIDEASMASFPKIANALRKSKNVILVGDFLQLHPFDEIKGQFANPDTKEQYKQCSTFSYFSYICLYLLKQIETNPDIQEIKLFPLVKNRRSHDSLVKYANEKFYFNLMEFEERNLPEDFQGHFLQDTVEECKPILMPTNNAPELMAETKKHIRKQFQFFKEKGSSYANLYQLAMTIALLNNILKLKDDANYPFEIIPEIGIIAIFNFHIQILKKWLWDNAEKIIPIPKNISFQSKNNELNLAINNFINNFYRTWLVERLEIGTVEKFQGREKKIIITNTVYNSVYDYNQNHIAFFDYKKLNVLLTRPKSYHFIISNDFEYKKKDFFQDLFQSKYVYRLHESKFKPLHETTKIEDLISFKKLENKLEGELIVTIKVLTAKEVNIGARGALVLSLEEFKGTDTDQLIEEEEKKSLKKIAEVFNKQKKLTNKNGRFDPTTNPDDSKLLNIVEYILSYCENYLEENLSHKPKETIEFMRYKLFEIFDGENFFPHIQEVYSKTGFDFIEGLTNLKQKIIDFFKEEKNES